MTEVAVRVAPLSAARTGRGGHRMPPAMAPGPWGAPVVAHQVRFPLAGMGIGQQVAWYRQHARVARTVGLTIASSKHCPPVPRPLAAIRHLARAARGIWS
jgi:hypothetical protein